MAEAQSASSPHKGRIRDARGKKVTQLDPVLMRYTRSHDVIPAEPLGKIASEIGTGWAIQGQIIFTGVWALAFVCLAIAHMVKWGGGLFLHPRELRLWSVLLGLFIINIIIVWFVSRHTRQKKVRRIMLKHGRCPHCGYDLRNLPVDGTDSATICPECGCAWKLASSPETTA
jgi:hypothetical protein